jgi:hypothetical protein
VRGVGLPQLVGQLGLEADDAFARALARLRRDETTSAQRYPAQSITGLLDEVRSAVTRP